MCINSLAPTCQNCRKLNDCEVKMSEYKKYMCVVCGFIYDEALGWEDDDIAAGTKWDDVPDNWICPDCGVGKEDFEMVEI